ncbi:serine/threonine protein kinase, putative, partial [Ixodes scapularis]
MSYLRGSPNYVWSTTAVLGKGATGAVYQGVNKQTGEPVAVKTFNQVSQMRPLEVQMREFEVLNKVNHENIVRLLAVEEDVESRSKVLVMELCTGGSLFTLLDDPANSYGLEEQDFLCKWRDCAGMKHLRDNNIIHRDLKPGNIMKYVAVDGRFVYKLADFGAARELQDDQQFMSLYGTEEYLHPDMYERAVLKKSAGKSFGATVDLWSIGVTLYHVATGNLPFRAYGGRRNRDTMFCITSKKESGVISGVQNSENGPIEWSKELPRSCLLSPGLRDKIVPLLAGLLECDDSKMWTFEQFFDSVTELLRCRLLHVFYINEGRELHAYL